MTTFTAITTTQSRESAEELSDAAETLEPFGAGFFEIEDGSGRFEVGLHFVDHPDEVALSLLAAAYDAKPFVISEVPEKDWVAHVRRELSPVVAGRFFLHGSHDSENVPPDAVPLLIEAAMAFGTGHHGTTLGCLLALDELAEQGKTFEAIADIGCGTAVLAMAAARLWPGRILAGDIDPVAVEVSAANIAANGLTGRILCEVAAGFDGSRLSAAGPYDLILANILKGPLIELAPEIANRLVSGGYAILSGLLTEQADEILTVYVQNGVNLAVRRDIGDWTTLILNRDAV